MFIAIMPHHISFGISILNGLILPSGGVASGRVCYQHCYPIKISILASFIQPNCPLNQFKKVLHNVETDFICQVAQDICNILSLYETFPYKQLEDLPG